MFPLAFHLSDRHLKADYIIVSTKTVCHQNQPNQARHFQLRFNLIHKKLHEQFFADITTQTQID